MVKLGLLSNERMARGINWTLLSDPLLKHCNALTDAQVIAPPDGWGALRELPRLAKQVRRVDALFHMSGRVRAPLAFQALSQISSAKLRAVFYVDPWAYLLERIAKSDRQQRHDLVFIPYREAYERLRAVEGGERYHYLPFAADTEVFRPSDAPRDIDILWMGRRDTALHEALLALSEKHGLTYLYREKTGFIDDPAELGALAARARYFVATPPPPERSGGFSPLVMRYIEGLSAGCRLIGVLPKSGEFEAILPRESLLEVAEDGSDLETRYLADQDNEAGWQASAKASGLVHAEHGWDARAKQIVAAMEERLEAMA